MAIDLTEDALRQMIMDTVMASPLGALVAEPEAEEPVAEPEMAQEEEPQEEEEKPEDEELEVMSKDAQEKLAKAEAEKEALTKRVATLEKRNRDIERKSHLESLRRSGNVLDVAEEMKTTEEYSDKQFTEHCARIKKSYQKVPMEMDLVHPGDSPEYQDRAEKEKALGEKAKKMVQRGEATNYREALTKLQEKESE